ncbi:MAG: type II secretion system protein [Candidatus Babeliales bacterium]
MGSVKKGFTFLELVVVIMLIGLLATIVVPNLQNVIPGYKRKEFLSRLTGLVRLSWQQALITQRAHRVLFDLEKRIVQVEIESEKKDKKAKPLFEPIKISYLNSTYQWTENIEIKQFFVEGKELIARPGIKTEQVWFYIAPDGLAQEVIINFVDTAQLDAGRPTTISLVLNPFSAQFREYDTFQKP